MKKQKLLSGALAGAMALSLAVPAFAANETTITATYSEPVIEVSVPTTATAIINPYKLDCKFHYEASTGKWVSKATETSQAFVTKGSGVATQPMVMVNYGENNLTVSATASAVVKTGSDMKVVTTTVNPDATGAIKNANIKVQAVDAGDQSAQWTADDAGKYSFNYDDTFAGVWAGLDWTSAAEAQVGATAAAELGTIKGISAETSAPQNGSFLAIRLDGEVVKKPKTAWTSKDGVTVTVAYSFEVAAAEEGEP